MKPTLLVVDDDQPLRDLYRLEFEEEGYRVLTAEGGREAMETLGRQRADLVILDLRMSGMDGLDTLDALLESHRDLPVVINSAYPNFKGDFGTWSADAYVVKSPNLDELKRRVREVLAQRGSRPREARRAA